MLEKVSELIKTKLIKRSQTFKMFVFVNSNVSDRIRYEVPFLHHKIPTPAYPPTPTIKHKRVSLEN